jgi:hypothetical protein
MGSRTVDVGVGKTDDPVKAMVQSYGKPAKRKGLNHQEVKCLHGFAKRFSIRCGQETLLKSVDEARMFPECPVCEYKAVS